MVGEMESKRRYTFRLLVRESLERTEYRLVQKIEFSMYTWLLHLSIPKLLRTQYCRGHTSFHYEDHSRDLGLMCPSRCSPKLFVSVVGDFANLTGVSVRQSGLAHCAPTRPTPKAEEREEKKSR